jgi:hypothetical protein
MSYTILLVIIGIYVSVSLLSTNIILPLIRVWATEGYSFHNNANSFNDIKGINNNTDSFNNNTGSFNNDKNLNENIGSLNNNKGAFNFNSK